MKKFLAVLLAVALCLSLGVTAFATDGSVLLIAPAPKADSCEVYVTIVDAGTLQLVQAPVTATDLDGDGVITITDGIAAAHAAYCSEGAEGYVTYESSFGYAISRLWGVENGGSYMYYLNDMFVLSLTDPIKTGDYITAYGFADLEGWSDVYTYFDKPTATVPAGRAVELTLMGYDFTLDPNGNASPMAGVPVYVDGQATELVTDENGKVSVTLDTVGKAVISAKSETATLTPPACVVTVTEAVADRSDVVTMLWEKEGKPVVNYLMLFEDVAAEQDYTEAVRWAASEKIVEGYSDTSFGPGDAVTREQLVTILWRYAKEKGIDVSAGEDTNILSYNDALEVSEWAIPAMQWACAANLVEGDEQGNLQPAAYVTAAAVQQMIDSL